MIGEILSLKSAEKLSKYPKLLVENQLLKNENKDLKEEIKRLKEKLRKGDKNEEIIQD